MVIEISTVNRLSIYGFYKTHRKSIFGFKILWIFLQFIGKPQQIVWEKLGSFKKVKIFILFKFGNVDNWNLSNTIITCS